MATVHVPSLASPPRSAAPTVPLRYLAWAIQLAEDLGIGLDGVLDGSGLAPAMLAQPGALTTPRQFDHALSSLLRRAGRSDLAFELGCRLNLASHDILGFAMLSSPCVDQVLRLAQRYYRLITPNFRLNYKRNGNEAELLFTPVLPMSPECLYFHEEAIGVATYRHIQSMLQAAPLNCHIYFSMQLPPHAARLRELAPARCHFGATPLPGVRMTLDAEQLDRRLPMANERSRDLAEERCRQLMQHVKEDSSWKQWVSMMLQAAVDCQPRLEELAGILNITSRTLDRYLRKEDTTFRALSLAIRNQRAQEMLADSELPVSQIAYRLGYTDVANFGHAFRSLNGCSPSGFRQRARLAAAI